MRLVVANKLRFFVSDLLDGSFTIFSLQKNVKHFVIINMKKANADRKKINHVINPNHHRIFSEIIIKVDDYSDTKAEREELGPKNRDPAYRK